MDGARGTSGGPWSGYYVGVNGLDRPAGYDEPGGPPPAETVGDALHSVYGETEPNVPMLPSEVPVDV